MHPLDGRLLEVEFAGESYLYLRKRLEYQLEERLQHMFESDANMVAVRLNIQYPVRWRALETLEVQLAEGPA